MLNFLLTENIDYLASNIIEQDMNEFFIEFQDFLQRHILIFFLELNQMKY